MKQICFLILLLTNWHIAAQYDVPITLLQQFNGKYDYTIIGNTHNEFDNFNTTPIPCQMLTQSSANLNLLPSQNIVAAYLIWSGIGTGNNVNIQLNGMTQIPDLINVADTEPIPGVSIYFSSLKNITNYVQIFGNGLYSVSNFDLNPIIGNYCSTARKIRCSCCGNRISGRKEVRHPWRKSKGFDVSCRICSLVQRAS